jgi:hypothetical protein
MKLKFVKIESGNIWEALNITEERHVEMCKVMQEITKDVMKGKYTGYDDTLEVLAEHCDNKEELAMYSLILGKGLEKFVEGGGNPLQQLLDQLKNSQ